MLPIYRSLAVYFAIPASAAGGSKIPFPDTPELNGEIVQIMGFEAFSDAQAPFTPSKLAVITAADSLDLVVTLNDGSNQRFKQMPYSSMIAANNGGIWKECLPFTWDAQKSVVQTTAAVAGGQAYFLFHYRLLTDPPAF